MTQKYYENGSRISAMTIPSVHCPQRESSPLLVTISKGCKCYPTYITTKARKVLEKEFVI